MKKNPADKAIMARMQPGVFSIEGFLGNDTRPIAEIVAADLAVLEGEGIEPDELADLLDELHEAADAGLGSTVTLADGAVKLNVQEVMGRISCPYGCGHRAHKAVITVRMPGVEFLLSPLTAHLIREHGFFQGAGSPFRLEPATGAALYRLCRPEPGLAKG